MDLLSIHRYLSGEATPEESREMECWLSESANNRKLFESCKSIYKVIPQNKYQFDAQRALIRFKKVMDEPSKVRKPQNRSYNTKPLFGAWLKIAAILLLTISLPVYYFSIDSGNHIETPSGMTIVTSPGEQKTFKMSDGSRITMNGDSEIYIPESYGVAYRKAYLIGEAFFEVEPNEYHPFIVESNTARVEVLGTSFAVRSWRGRDESVVSVYSGLVSVGSPDTDIDKAIHLSSGEYTTIRKNKAPDDPQSQFVDQFLGWTRQVFIFEETPLKDVLRQLEIHFNVTIHIEDTSGLSDPVTARYQNESLNEILKYTTITHGVDFEIKNSHKH